MTNEQLIKANALQSEIRTLEAECNLLEPDWRTKQTRKRSIKQLLGKPTKKSHNGYYYVEVLTCIGEAIVIYPDEVDVLREYKQQKIAKLKEKLNNL